MSYRSILVHLTDVRRAPGVLSAARRVADPGARHVAGIAVLPPPIVIPAMDAGPATTVEQHRTDYAGEIERLESAFSEAFRQAGQGNEWIIEDARHSSAVDRVLDHAHTADLVISSQQDPAWGLSWMLEAPERLVLESGRPVLLVPSTWQRGTVGKRVLAAWDGRREATRAIFDALPLLKAAESVFVMRVNPQSEGSAAAELPDIDICTALARHGIKCEAIESSGPSHDAGKTLLSAAEMRGADLLVMGCYGHSRMREMVIGGVTRHVLRHMTIPVLMSH